MYFPPLDRSKRQQRVLSRRRFWVAISMLPVLAGMGFIGACAHNPAQEWPEPRPGNVTDLEAFNEFLARQPSPDIFSSVYPHIVLILPGMIATQEFRTDNSRFFAELGPDGRILSGNFR